jgi:hypothetical protein
MATISDGFNTYADRDGKRELINPDSASMKMGDDELFRFEGKSGILELSMSQSDIDQLVAAHGGLPIAEMTVPVPFAEPIIQNVRAIRPLPKKDGTFLMAITGSVNETRPPTPQPTTWRDFLRKILG